MGRILFFPVFVTLYLTTSWNIIKKIGISNLKILKLLEKWLDAFFTAQGKDKLKAMYKIASLSSRFARHPLIDAQVLRSISDLLAGATFLEEQGLQTFARILTEKAEAYLESLLYKLLPSLERRVIIPEEESTL